MRPSIPKQTGNATSETEVNVQSFMPREPGIFHPKTLKEWTLYESLSILEISHGIVLSFCDKIAGYLNGENVADLIYLNLTKILDVVWP